MLLHEPCRLCIGCVWLNVQWQILCTGNEAARMREWAVANRTPVWAGLDVKREGGARLQEREGEDAVHGHHPSETEEMEL